MCFLIDIEPDPDSPFFLKKHQLLEEELDKVPEKAATVRQTAHELAKS